MKKVNINNNLLFNADCLDAFTYLADNSIDLILTDPPYFLHGMDNNWCDKNLNDKKNKPSAIGGLPVGMKFDPKQGQELQKFFYNVSLHAMRVLKPGGFMIAFSQGRLLHRLCVACEDAGFEIRDMIIWEHDGGQGKAFTQNHFVKKMKITENEKMKIIKKLNGRKTPQLRPKFEPMTLAQKPREGTFVENFIKWDTGLIDLNLPKNEENLTQQTNIFQFKKPKKDKEFDHMTIKPIDLLKRLISVFSQKNQIILDPFMGSGTTAIACENTNRKFVGFEIEKKYFDMVINRIKGNKYEEIS